MKFLNGLLVLSLILGMALPVQSFQVEAKGEKKSSTLKLSVFEKIEAGLATLDSVPPALYALSQGDYEIAFNTLTPEVERQYPWIREHVLALLRFETDLVRVESENFVFYLPENQLFLKDYAIPNLEKAAQKIHKLFGHKPKHKIRVEIYANKDDFSLASTLDEETLKRSGAIGICKFHRLMIVSPAGLPLGYRWMDALCHEYMHLIINELSYAKAELWLHEGTARYFDTSYRSNPPSYLSPNQKTQLLEAQENKKLIEFKRMSPSLVYLDSQEEVSLAFSQVSHAVDTLISGEGIKKFVNFLKELRKKTFPKAFKKIYGVTPEEFEANWILALGKEDWKKTKGALPDKVQFEPINEEDVIGASVKAQVRLGDRMRKRGKIEAALIQYEKALKGEPDNAIILLKAARMDLKLKKQLRAEKRLKKAIESNPNYITPYIELAKWGKPGDAVGYLETANAINPFNPEIHYLLAIHYHELGKKDLANRERDIFNQLLR